MRERSMWGVRLRTSFWGLWGALLLLKLWLAVHLPLFGDEAFYWLESRHPAPAYDDVPGLTAWLIMLGTRLFGDGTLGVRLPFVIIGALTAWWLSRIVASVSGDAAAGWMAGTVALLLPLFAVNGLLALPDVPLTLATLASVAALLRLTGSDGRSGHWLLAGALALGWFSHYRFAVVFVAGGLWLLLDADGRALLRRRRFWLAGLAGCAVGLAPLLWHQFANAGGGFAFQFDQRHPWRFQPEGLADPLLQAVVTTPWLYLLLLAAFASMWRHRRHPGIGLIAGVAACILALYMLLAPFVDTERSRLHWPLPGWMLLAMLVPFGWSRWPGRARRWARLAVVLGGMSLCVVMTYLLLAAHAPERLAATRAYPHNFAGWPQIARLVERTLAELPPETVLVADNFMLAAELSFELGGRPVYSLDHELNRKHGRQGELARFGLDQSALLVAARDRPVLLVADHGATALRQRPHWYRQVCDLLPAAEPWFDHTEHHGRKRYFGWLQRPGRSNGCLPPPLGYLDQPVAGETLSGTLRVTGWAIRDRAGIERLWLLIDGRRVVAVDYGIAAPGVRREFPDSDDPGHPDVGFALELSPELTAGRHWISIEAESAGGIRSVLASVPVWWSPAPAGATAR